MDAADFYTGLVADAYAVLKGETFDSGRYADFVRTHGEPALEVGCGDGHPLLELRRQSLDVEGLDSSADMLERARARAVAEGLDVVLHEARMEEMDLPRRYRSIYLAGPTFTLLPDDAAALGALQAFGRHLADGGAVLVPLWIPGPTPADQLGAVRETVDEQGTSLRYSALAEDLDVPSRTRRTWVRYEREAPGAEVETVDREWVIHWQTRDSLRALCATAGLLVRSVSDDGGEPDQPGSQFTAVLTHP